MKGFRLGRSQKLSTTSRGRKSSTCQDLKPVNEMLTSRGICLNWSSRSIVNSYLLFFRSLEPSVNLKLDFSGELIIFSAFFNLCFYSVSL